MKDDATSTISREPKELEKTLFLNRRLIGIDGDPGAGKSRLAKEIQQLVGGKIIALDNFLRAPGQSYLSQYMASSLADHYRQSDGIPKIIEGVVLLDALEFLNACADIVVFATREIDGVGDYVGYLDSRRMEPKTSSTREIVDYYRRRRPWDLAQLRTTLHIKTC